MDLEVRLGCGDCDASPGVILRTGPVMLVSSDPQQPGQGPARRRGKREPGRSSPPRPPQHVLSAAEAAAHLSAVIRQRSIATRLGVSGAAGEAARGNSAAASGSSLDAAAAVAAVQQHLLYAQFELSVAELQIVAVNLSPLPAQGSEAAGGHGSVSPTGVAGSAAGGAPFDRHLHTLLQPMRLGGTLKMHRIPEASPHAAAKGVLASAATIRPLCLSACLPVHLPAGLPACLPVGLLDLCCCFCFQSLSSRSSCLRPCPPLPCRTTRCRRCSWACRPTPSRSPSPSTL